MHLVTDQHDLWSWCEVEERAERPCREAGVSRDDYQLVRQSELDEAQLFSEHRPPLGRGAVAQQRFDPKGTAGLRPLVNKVDEGGGDYHDRPGNILERSRCTQKRCVCL